MKQKILLLILTLIIFGCENNAKEILPCNINVDNGLTYFDGKLYTGTCNFMFNDTLLIKTRTYKRGKIVEEIGYYNDGSIEYIGEEKDGLIHGDFISYYPNGEISIEGQVNKGEFTGKWNYYDDDGSLNKTLYYNKNGEVTDSIFHK